MIGLVAILAACSDDPTAPAADDTPTVTPVLAVTGTPTGPVTSKLNTRMCLDVYGEANKNGAKVVLWTCNSGSNQQWTATSAGELRVFGDKCLDVLNEDSTDGKQLVIWACNGGPNQKWQQTSSGQLRGLDGKCADIWNENARDGQPIVIYTCHSGTNQQWNAPAVSGGTPTEPEPTPPPTASSCSEYSYKRLVRVSSTSQLSSALQNAQPGDRIQLADGVYSGRFRIVASGTASAPIVLCGSRQAVIDGGGIGNHIAVLFLQNADHWVVGGITLRNAIRGVIVEGSDRVRLTGLEIYNIGNSAININKFSRHTLVDGNHVHDTGKGTAQYGEGVYVGSYYRTWANGAADRSDSTTIRNNVFGPNIGAEIIDVKEGTTGTVITGNTLNGRGQNPSTTNLNSLVVISGNRVTMTGNKLENATEHGVITYVQLSPWGTGHVFRTNTVQLNSSSSYAFNIGSSSTIVGCDNTVINGRLANVACK